MNEEGKRPGGLTALAVINFILVGLGLLSLLSTVAAFTLADRIPTENMNETQRAQFEAFQNMGTPMLVFILGLNLLSAVLLLLSGIGYLQQRRILGRMVGNVYAVTAIIGSIVSGLLFAAGFNIGTIISLIYPIVTLVLINTTFKDDLTN